MKSYNMNLTIPQTKYYSNQRTLLNNRGRSSDGCRCEDSLQSVPSVRLLTSPGRRPESTSVPFHRAGRPPDRAAGGGTPHR